MVKAKGPIVSMPVVWATNVVPQMRAAINIRIWALVLLKIVALVIGEGLVKVSIIAVT